VTNQNGKEYLKQKEYADLVDKLQGYSGKD
jgi:hypothetical protein